MYPRAEITRYCRIPELPEGVVDEAACAAAGGVSSAPAGLALPPGGAPRGAAVAGRRGESAGSSGAAPVRVAAG